MTFSDKLKKKESFFDVSEEIELMTFLLKQLPQRTRNSFKILFKYKKILVDGRIETQYNFLLSPGQKVTIQWDKNSEAPTYSKVKIVFEDNDIIIIDKQEGVLSIATSKETSQTAYSILSNHVKKQHPNNKIFVVHRLDRETSGLMMFAKNQQVQHLLQEAWHTTITERSYAAVTEGIVDPPAGTITSWLRESKALIVYSSQNPKDGEKAITHYETIKNNKLYSLLKINLETGRKNQIRVHMQDIKHSVIGDKKYGSTVNPIGRLGLHAWILEFIHPITKKKLRFETDIPKNFLGLLK
jgi:23S rRNA pseudouridine1911/1915/1917 synthase